MSSIRNEAVSVVESSHSIPFNVGGLSTTITPRTLSIQLAYVSGQSVTNFVTIPAGTSYSPHKPYDPVESLANNGNYNVFITAAGSDIIEIETL